MTWRRVAPYFARRIQIAIFLIAVVFGVDYLVTPHGSSSALTTVERTFLPLWAWGATILACGIAGLVVERFVLGDDHHPALMTEERWRWGWVSNVAHVVLFAVFVALAGSSLADVVMRGLHGGGFYGWRTTVMWAGYAYANWLFVQRLGDFR